MLVTGGMRVGAIAVALRIARNTLKKHFAVELHDGRAKRSAEVMMAMYRRPWGGQRRGAEGLPRGVRRPYSILQQRVEKHC